MIITFSTIFGTSLPEILYYLTTAVIINKTMEMIKVK